MTTPEEAAAANEGHETGAVHSPATSAAIGIARLIIGLTQGVALYFLYNAWEARTWPATDGQLLVPMVMVTLFLPVIAIQGLGNIRLRALIPWLAVAGALIAAFAWYDNWAAWPVDWDYREQTALPNIAPSAMLVGFTVIWLFVAHALVTGADRDRRIIAGYGTHFDVAWKFALRSRCR